ncbi:MAG: 5'-nucleotidase C-terminal domain-containing protein [Caldilineales bacterium]|nr:5'-nucleotidase C-terminal domain-containing protein [Caldilineales bacterium]
MRPKKTPLRIVVIVSLALLLLMALGGVMAASAAVDPPPDDGATVQTVPDVSILSLPPGDATRFRGYIRSGSPEAPGAGIPGVTVRAYGYNAGQSWPGALIQTRTSDGSGFFNLYILPQAPWLFDYYLLEVETPAGMVGTAAWSEDGDVIDNTHIEWFNPGGPADFVHMNEFYFNPGFGMTVLHTNDFHARVEQYSGMAGSARIKTKVDEIRSMKENVLLVDAGDQSTGTIYYTLGASEVIATMMNALDYDVMTIGNHEFDKGVEEFGQLVDSVDFPIVTANVDVSAEPLLAGKLPPNTVFEMNGEKIGVFGLTTEETSNISSPGANIVFKDVTTSAQAAVDALKEQGVNKIIALTHIGYVEDVALAGVVSGIDVIVGGHSHTFLYSPATPQVFTPPNYSQTPAGSYPTVVQSPSSEPVLVVTAQEWGRFLGDLDVAFDPNGVVMSYEGNPIYMGSNIIPDPATNALLDPYRAAADELKKTIVAQSEVDFPLRDDIGLICRRMECLLGDIVTDAMLWKINSVIPDPAEQFQIVIQNGGGLRAPIPAGDVSLGQIIEVLPFGNTIATMGLQGMYIREALENGVSQVETGAGRFPQVSGLRYTWNPTVPAGSRILNVEVKNADGTFSPLDEEAVYPVVTNNFMRQGGDGYTVFRDHAIEPYDAGPPQEDALAEYMAMLSPVQESDIPTGRITQVDKVITILHTNDTHGTWPATDYRGTLEGFEYLATLIAQERANNPNVLLLDAGDTFQGNAFAQYFRNATPNPIAGGMNMLDYDAFMLGNHEFNFGPQTFATMMGQLDMPILGKANLTDDGSYGFINDNVDEYINLDVDGVKVTIWGTTNPRVYRYELPSNIPGLTFLSALDVAATRVPEVIAAEDPDLFIALNHIGFSPYGDEIDSDKLMAEQVAGIDVIVGGHSHTKLDPAVMVTSDVNPEGTLIAQSERYAIWLGKVTVGLAANPDGGYDVVYREGHLLPAGSVDTDPAMTAYLQPFKDELATYTGTEIGQTTRPIDALNAYTEETSGANLQADSAVWALENAGVNVDFHLSGAMSNRKIADDASDASPVTLTINDMYTLMPYENSLLTMSMNGPQIKRVLERAYRNYWYYKYDEAHGGYSYYTTCMLDINEGGVITYNDAYPAEPDGNNVVSLEVGGVAIDFNDANTYYNVSTVNYLAGGSCNFNDAGETIWPLEQIVADTQYYVRDSVIDYITAMGTVAPEVEGRLVFQTP